MVRVQHEQPASGHAEGDVNEIEGERLFHKNNLVTGLGIG